MSLLFRKWAFGGRGFRGHSARTSFQGRVVIGRERVRRKVLTGAKGSLRGRGRHNCERCLESEIKPGFSRKVDCGSFPCSLSSRSGSSSRYSTDGRSLSTSKDRTEKRAQTRASPNR